MCRLIMTAVNCVGLNWKGKKLYPAIRLVVASSPDYNGTSLPK